MGIGLLIGLFFFFLGLFASPIFWGLGLVVLFMWVGSLDDRAQGIGNRPVPTGPNAGAQAERDRVQARMKEYAEEYLKQQADAGKKG